MAPVAPVEVRTRGDRWAVEHTDLGAETFDSFVDAADTARSMAADLNVEVVVEHPRNVSLDGTWSRRRVHG